MPVSVSIFFNYPLSAIINFSIVFPISDTELLESDQATQFHNNILKMKKQIREFADLVDKLDDLEKKQYRLGRN